MKLPSKNLPFHFATLFIPAASIVIGFVCMIFYMKSHNEIDRLKTEGVRLTRLHEQTIARELKKVASDLMCVSEHAQFRSFLEKPSEAARQALADEFLALIVHSGMYDQVRYLDDTGREIIRADARNGNPTIVPAAQLQHKGDRYYFAETVRLNRGEIFVSPFDLNVEHGEIERPFKPVIRVATPLFDRSGNKKGILILNYLGRDLLDQIDTIMQAMDSQSSILLLNPQGYWLKGLRPEDEWGFMFEDEERTFSRAFPQAWAQLGAEKAGQFRTTAGMFSFNTIYPLAAAQIGRDSYFWKLVVYLPEVQLTANTRRLFSMLLPLLLATTALIGTGSFYMARAKVRQAEHEDHIERLAHFDTLTGLPNRALLHDRLGQLIAQAERSSQAFALLFIDLDGFKSVNDRYGHKAGDAVLKEAAARIRSQVRKSDTAARMGGDEFLIALTDVKDRAAAGRVAAKIVNTLARPIPISAETQAVIGASIGISIYPDDGREMDVLIRHADETMYEAKSNGKNRFRFHTRQAPA